jgi:hypothetical protein
LLEGSSVLNAAAELASSRVNDALRIWNFDLVGIQQLQDAEVDV